MGLDKVALLLTAIIYYKQHLEKPGISSFFSFRLITFLPSSEDRDIVRHNAIL